MFRLPTLEELRAATPQEIEIEASNVPEYLLKLSEAMLMEREKMAVENPELPKQLDEEREKWNIPTVHKATDEEKWRFAQDWAFGAIGNHDTFTFVPEFSAEDEKRLEYYKSKGYEIKFKDYKDTPMISDKVQNMFDKLAKSTGMAVSMGETGQRYGGAMFQIDAPIADFMADNMQHQDLWNNLVQGQYKNLNELSDAMRVAGDEQGAAILQEMIPSADLQKKFAVKDEMQSGDIFGIWGQF